MRTVVGVKPNYKLFYFASIALVPALLCMLLAERKIIRRFNIVAACLCSLVPLGIAILIALAYRPLINSGPYDRSVAKSMLAVQHISFHNYPKTRSRLPEIRQLRKSPTDNSEELEKLRSLLLSEIELCAEDTRLSDSLRVDMDAIFDHEGVLWTRKNFWLWQYDMMIPFQSSKDTAINAERVVRAINQQTEFLIRHFDAWYVDEKSTIVFRDTELLTKYKALGPTSTDASR